MTTQDTQTPIIIGRFAAPFGVQGWIKVVSFTDPPSNILDYQPWLIERNGKWQPITITASKLQGKDIVVKIIDFDDRDQVRMHTNCNIGIWKEQLPALENEYYWSDLVGLEVVNNDGKSFGTIDHLTETGANDVMIIKGATRVLIPYHPDVVVSVDMENGKLIVDWEE